MSNTVHIAEVIHFLRRFEAIIAPATTCEEALYELEKEFIATPQIGMEIRQVSSQADKQLLQRFIGGMGVKVGGHCWWLHKGNYEDFKRGRQKLVQDRQKRK